MKWHMGRSQTQELNGSKYFVVLKLNNSSNINCAPCDMNPFVIP
jgi:hypothetical protein